MTAPNFSTVLNLIRQAQARALQNVHRELIGLYWQIGEYLHEKTAQDGWGRGTVKELADWLAQQNQDTHGFSAHDPWRMKQFYVTYSGNPKLSPLARELSWTQHRRAAVRQRRRAKWTRSMRWRRASRDHLSRASE